MGNFLNELRNYQPIPRELIFDETLSDRARFVYCFMASKPDDWEFFLTPMASEIGYSVDTLRKYMNELIEAGWLERGEQKRSSGTFSSVTFVLKATKNTVSEKTRLGKNPTQHNIDDIQKRDENKEIEDKSSTKKVSEAAEAMFEECWVVYMRKGSKAKAKKEWMKLTDVERNAAKEHISHYVGSVSNVRYMKDFERYIRDKCFLNVVYKDGKIDFDPSVGSDENSNTVCEVEDFKKVVLNGIEYR